ncbi:uncharacterized protein LOC130667165 [Microplitis mediator]|uniref:uncharacterized protein LOC130667165 n=1 Tax=Microplitis mediator TaxID=375433 RepID=UPI0025542880|nr:uncharacterized protein LOC130667165 [Microplitis mediator]
MADERNSTGDGAPKDDSPSLPITPNVIITGSDEHSTTPTGITPKPPGNPSDSDITDAETRKALDSQDPKKRTRRKSAKGCELELRISGQLSRLRLISDFETRASALTAAAGAASLKARLDVLTQEWQEFSVIHDYLASNATEDFLQHSYIKDGIFDVTYRSYLGARTRLSTLIHELDTPAQPTQAQNSTQRPQSSVNLAPLNITPFSGDYAKWPEFRDMFKSVVINRTGLEDVERLHYLKTYLTGQAAQAIANTPMCNESFPLAWGAICKRYDVPRLLIGAQLDKLVNLPALTSRSSKQLYSLIDQTHEAINALLAQKVNLQDGDCYLLTHIIISKLDRSTREAWELSLGASVEFPKLSRLRQFLTERARAQERYEESTAKAGDQHKSSHSNSHSNSKGHKTSYAHMATSSAPKSAGASTPASAQPKVVAKAQYPCDLCQGDHYLVRCDQFGKMTPPQRTQLVIQARLCPNCLGHHRVESCNSQFRCRVCQEQHHSMIHPGIPATQTRGAPAQTQ